MLSVAIGTSGNVFALGYLQTTMPLVDLCLFGVALAAIDLRQFLLVGKLIDARMTIKTTKVLVYRGR